MKNFYFSFLFLFLSTFTFSQYAENGTDWIDYSKTYYKFKIEEDGIYRITHQTLINAGIPESSITGNFVQLWKNGEQVPVYVSTTGQFGSDDFVEFHATINDGSADTPLYEEADWQPSLDKSLFEQVGTYFLVFSQSGSSTPIVDAPNNLSNLPAKEDYYYETVDYDIDEWNSGKRYKVGGVTLYKSEFEYAEGYNIRKSTRLRDEFNVNNVYNGKPAYFVTKLTPDILYNSPNEDIDFVMRLQGSDVYEFTLPAVLQYETITNTVSSSNLRSTMDFQIRIASTQYGMLIAKLYLEYPREFIFDNISYQKLKLVGNGEKYLELNSIGGGADIVFYNNGTNERLTVENEAVVKIKSSIVNNGELVFDSDISEVSELNEVNFTEFENSADLLIVYNDVFAADYNGENLLNKYISHKQSDIGGNWTVNAVDIADLYDQFSYGITGHVAAFKNAIQELKSKNQLPTHIFIIGKGLEYNHLINQPEYADMHYVPTFGSPGSDSRIVTDYHTSQINMATAIGRISIKTLEEFDSYLNKLIEYETIQFNTDDQYQTKDKIWMKNSLHLGGGKTQSEQNLFKSYLNLYKSFFEDPYYGGKATSIFKTSTDPVEPEESNITDSLLNNGVSIVTFFGHASANTIEFNIQNPEAYDNYNKYSLFLTNGCIIGNIFNYSRTNISEDFVLIPERGSIGFLGPTSYGIAQAMNSFTTQFYEDFSFNNYYGTIGENMQRSLNQISGSSLYAILTKEQMVYHGDPTLKLNPHEKPDYLIEEDDISFLPNNIGSNDEFVEITCNISNIGKAINETVLVRLTRTLPNGDTEIYDQEVDNLYYQEEVTFVIETNAILNEGINQFQVEIDPDDNNDEITNANNQLASPITKQILSSTVTPVFPYEFGVTNDQNVTLVASSVNIYDVQKEFIFEIDTTELFNSSFKQSSTVQSFGSTLTWQPSISYQNETVYYWRTKLNEDNSEWTNSSFVYLNDYQEGWNQSHYFQYLKDENEGLYVDDNRNFEYNALNRKLSVYTSIPPTIPRPSVSYYLDDVRIARWYCSDITILVFDKDSGDPEENYRVSGNTGKYNSKFCDGAEINQFSYDVKTSGERKHIMDMLDQIDDGDFVLISSDRELKPDERNWEGDTQIYGYNLFDKLEELGATQARNIKERAAYVYYFQKGNPDFEYQFEHAAANNNEIINESLILPAKNKIGSLSTQYIGPAISWNKYLWDWDSSYDNDANGDRLNYSIFGTDGQGTETLLFENETMQELDLSSLDANQYPYLKLMLTSSDPVNLTSPQLNYWRLVYEKAPELAINMSEAAQVFPFEGERGQPITLNYSIDNIGGKDMSEVLVRYTFTNGAGNRTIVDKRYDALPTGESLDISYDLETVNVNNVGLNSVFIDVNPDEDQIEQYHFNNIAYITYKLAGDNENPYLDVTFDGIHIIDGDLIGDEPNIIISLSDDNIYLPLNNPDDFEIILQHPNSTTPFVYDVNSPEITFYPADVNNLDDENRAIIEFNPTFDPGKYEMTVQAKDISNNVAGENYYKISFEVTDEDIISRVINYPNPFTTRTEFIANIVGEAPDEIYIQIFAPNGKVIKEIEAIPSQITVSRGNNFYKIAEWDGTDDFGDPIGNGVYYYKVTMKRGGEIIDPQENESYSQYYHNGIGKLYIVR